MTQPHWNDVAVVKVATNPRVYWTRVVDFVPGSRLLRFEVVDRDQDKKSVPAVWKRGNQTVGPEGILSNDARTGYLCPSALSGAVIGKLGGSASDYPDPSQSTAPWGNKRVFAIGAFCVISVAAADAGPLYLTLNDDAKTFPQEAGPLWVRIQDAPL